FPSESAWKVPHFPETDDPCKFTKFLYFSASGEVVPENGPDDSAQSLNRLVFSKFSYFHRPNSNKGNSRQYEVCYNNCYDSHSYSGSNSWFKSSGCQYFWF